MRDTNTNQVHVVALTRKVWDGWPADLSPVDEVEKHRVYHYPTVGSYRKIVPNYMGFRYDGVLKSIHHVDGYEIIDLALRPRAWRPRPALGCPGEPAPSRPAYPAGPPRPNGQRDLAECADGRRY